MRGAARRAHSGGMGTGQQDVTIAYDDVGQGTPVVLVHGSWGTRHNWDAVVPLLAARHRVVAYDRRGHGDSEQVPGQGTFAEDVADLAALIERLDLAPAWVVGGSAGGIIALGLACTRPELTRGVLVHEPPVRGVLGAGAEEPIRAVLDLIREGHHSDAARTFVEQVGLGPGVWSLLPESIRTTMTAHAPTFLDEESAPDSRQVDERALAAYDGPVLVSEGDRSPPAFAGVADHVVSLLPQAHRVTYAGAGHIPHQTHPEEFAAEVLAFIDR